MARPRESTDTQLLDAAGRVLAATGARGFTLAKVAAAAGVSPAALIKRFGSKRDLLVALSRAWVASVDLPPAAPPGLDGLREVALGPYRGLHPDGTRRVAAARAHLSALAVDLEDDELRGLLAQGWARRRAQLEHCLRAAAADLPHAPPALQAAHMLFALLDGLFLGWSVQPDGELGALLRTHLDTLVRSWQKGSATHEPHR